MKGFLEEKNKINYRECDSCHLTRHVITYDIEFLGPRPYGIYKQWLSDETHICDSCAEKIFEKNIIK